MTPNPTLAELAEILSVRQHSKDPSRVREDRAAAAHLRRIASLTEEEIAREVIRVLDPEVCGTYDFSEPASTIARAVLALIHGDPS